MSVLLCAGLAWPPLSGAAPTGADAADAPMRVEVLGAVARPGPVDLSAPALTDGDRIWARAGGARSEAYRFAGLLLRGAAATTPAVPCVAPGARHAALLIADDPGLGGRIDLITGLLEGRVQRLPLPDRPFGRLGSDRAAPLLRAGAVLALPQRTPRVYVVQADGAVASLAHRAERMAADYLDQLPRQRLRPRRDYVLHYPDGSVTGLALEAWNAQPTAVPPGSMLAPATGCLPVRG
jgi:hypothetical protein